MTIPSNPQLEQLSQADLIVLVCSLHNPDDPERPFRVIVNTDYPDSNPIEECISQIKALLRAAKTRTA